ncbi:CvpA family protein [Sinanaerobacter chloroacetimidivorans]|uniref:CvpA family protein n=1 Tax=Sinanaerobacter chloroacetimidivorans TaxID=2818044 RepID=A0A8J8B302_9FIRM|nr:CvpA family protein [Sinanaerobacter chloroacetimidivorans]MBR0599242.1 CvpA family protein [Sinanaerobacter chloroacetimidivorans]
MWFDVIIAAILILSLIQGYRHGFVHTFIHTVGWVLAVVLGFVWFPYVVDFLKNKTDFYSSIQDKIALRIADNAGTATDSALNGFPEVIREAVTKTVDTAADAISASIAGSLANILFSIIAFLIVAAVIKVIILFITSIFSKRSNGGFIGGIDGFFGIFAGALKGIVIIYLLLALMVPVTNLLGSEWLIDELNASVFGNYLYNNNLVFFTVNKFI